MDLPCYRNIILFYFLLFQWASASQLLLLFLKQTLTHEGAINAGRAPIAHALGRDAGLGAVPIPLAGARSPSPPQPCLALLWRFIEPSGLRTNEQTLRRCVLHTNDKILLLHLGAILGQASLAVNFIYVLITSQLQFAGRG